MNLAAHLTGQFVTLAIILSTFNRTGSDPAVIVYTFVLLALARFITVEILVALNRWVKASRPYLSYFCSPPSSGRKPNLVYDKNTNKPSGDWGYFFFVAVPALIAFAILSKTEEGVTFERFQAQAQWTLIYTAVYWVQELLGRSAIVDFQKERIFNLAYNMGNVMVLFFAVMVGGFLFAWFGKIHSFSPWVVCGPLLVIKHGYDFFHWRKKWKPARFKWEIG